MVRKIIIVFSIIVIIFLIVLGVLFFITRGDPKPDESAFTQKVREIFPFGKPARNPDDLFPGENTNSTGTAGDTQPAQTSAQSFPRLRQITKVPTAGSLIWVEIKPITKERIQHIRFVDRATGHVSDTLTDSLEIKKISNTTVPKIYEAKFASPDSFIGRFLGDDGDDIKTYFVSLKDKIVKNSTTSVASNSIVDIAPKESVGNYLDENIKELSFSPDRSKILYSLYTENGGALVISNPNGTGKRQIYASPLREWLIDWQTGATAVITTKPSGLVRGFSYTLNTGTGGINKIAGNIFGLTILPKVGSTQYLVGEGTGSVSLSVLKKEGGSDKTTYLGKTLPEKCAWSKKEVDIIYCAIPSSIILGAYPDDWYQGSISFNDSIWKINTLTAQTSQLVIPERESGESIDAVNLELSDNDAYLTFINKKDLTLWGYQIELPIKPAATTTATSTPRT